MVAIAPTTAVTTAAVTDVTMAAEQQQRERSGIGGDSGACALTVNNIAEQHVIHQTKMVRCMGSDHIFCFLMWSPNRARHAGVISYVGVGPRKV